MGVLPYSFTGYNYSTSEKLDTKIYPDTVTATRLFYGQGGISQVYTGIAFKFFKHLSLGVNTYYMFGNNQNNRELGFNKSGFNTGHHTVSIKVKNMT
jgi:hypothetical protein